MRLSLLSFILMITDILIMFIDLDHTSSTATFVTQTGLTLTFPVQGHLIFLQYITCRLTIAFKFVLSGSSQILLPLCNPAIPSLAVSCFTFKTLLLKITFTNYSLQNLTHNILPLHTKAQIKSFT